VIYRPSLITASRTGAYVRSDLMARCLSYMIRHGLSFSARNQISFLPVDVCANNFVALALALPPSAMPTTLHLTANTYYTMDTVCRQIERDFGYGFRTVTLAQTVDHMNDHCGPDDPLYPLRAFFNNNHRRIETMRDKRYDNSRYRSLCAQVPGVMPEPPLAETVAGIVAFLRNANMIPPPPVAAAEPAAILEIAAATG
jgi:thioester reductase-like protein